MRRLRLARERHRDHHALAHAARELVRVGVDVRLGRRDADERAASRSRARAPRGATSSGAGGSPRRSARPPCRRGSGSSSAPGRSSRSRCRGRPASRARRGASRSLPRSSIVPGSIAPGGVRDEAQDRERRHALAAAALADDADAWRPRRRRTTTSSTARRTPCVGAKARHEIAHAKERSIVRGLGSDESV